MVIEGELLAREGLHGEYRVRGCSGRPLTIASECSDNCMTPQPMASPYPVTHQAKLSQLSYSRFQPSIEPPVLVGRIPLELPTQIGHSPLSKSYRHTAVSLLQLSSSKEMPM